MSPTASGGSPTPTEPRCLRSVRRPCPCLGAGALGHVPCGGRGGGSGPRGSEHAPCQGLRRKLLAAPACLHISQENVSAAPGPGQHFCGHSQMFSATMDRTHDGSFRGFSQFLSATSNPGLTGTRAVWVPSAPSFAQTSVTPGSRCPVGSPSGRCRGGSVPERSLQPVLPSSPSPWRNVSRLQLLRPSEGSVGPWPGGLGVGGAWGTSSGLSQLHRACRSRPGQGQVAQTCPGTLLTRDTHPLPPCRRRTLELQEASDLKDAAQNSSRGPSPFPPSTPSTGFVQRMLICILKALRRPSVKAAYFV